MFSGSTPKLPSLIAACARRIGGRSRASVAQRIEHRHSWPEAAGSIPAGCTAQKTGPRSSIGQSGSLLRSRLQVRILPRTLTGHGNTPHPWRSGEITGIRSGSRVFESLLVRIGLSFNIIYNKISKS